MHNVFLKVRNIIERGAEEIPVSKGHGWRPILEDL